MSKMFHFKQFSVSHGRSAMKVGTDGVLLGAWCDVEGATAALDIGTGCGVIALMLAQRNADVAVDAIDIDLPSVEEARANFASSPWSDRLNVVHADFNRFAQSCVKRYDLIVSNPPFFSNGVLPPDERRLTARHNASLTMRQLMTNAASLLNGTGLLAIVTPVELHDEVLNAAQARALHATRLTRVTPVCGGSTRRLLWQFSKCDDDVCAEDELCIENSDHTFTRDYVTITHDFYLKM